MSERIKIHEFVVDGSVQAELFIRVEDDGSVEGDNIPTVCNVCYSEDSFEVVDGKWHCTACGSEFCRELDE
jgi:hypothetical protein